MQKIKKLALILICTLSLVLLLASCDSGDAGAPSLPDNGGTSDGTTDDTPDDTCAHDQTEWKIDKNASCTETGAKHLECLSCKKTVESATIDKTEHTEEIVPATPATCSQSGLTAGKKCSVCNTVLLAQDTVPTKPHTEQIVPGKKESCTQKGLTDGKKCTVCNATLTEQTEIPIAPHSESEWIIDQNAKVGVAGSKHKECLSCGLTLATEAIPAIPEEHVHVGSQWITVTPSTCKVQGVKHFVCECGQLMEIGSLEVIPHTEQIIPAVSSTCQATGLTEGKKCSVCGDILVRQSATAKANHTEETVLGVAATCTSTGLTDGKRCSVCTATIVSQISIPAKGHNFEEGSCTRCGIGEPYGVWIVDGQGNPITNVIVKIMQGGNQVKMYPYKGEFLSMSLDTGSYEIELDLSQLSESYTYDESLCVLTPQKRTTTIQLYKSVGASTDLFVGYPLSKDYKAYDIGEGATRVTLTPDDYTFFVFRPTVAAIYTFTYECDSTLAISYHGSTFFAQGADLTDSSDDIARYGNGISVNIYASNLGADYVIGVKGSASACVISIKNVGDPGTRVEDMPWTAYTEDASKVEQHLSVKGEGTYTTVDVTDLSLKAVFNEADGFYHLGTADGPIIFIDLTSDTSFVSSIQTICCNQRMGTYIYDVYGRLLEKRSYNELFIQYGMPDTEGVTLDSPLRVPLTAKLAEAIQTFGEKNNWWKPDSESNIFTSVLLGAPYNQEYAWLLFCGYYVA